MQHELGKGQSAFKWHKRSKPETFSLQDQPSDHLVADEVDSPEESEQQGGETFTEDFTMDDSSSVNSSSPTSKYSPDDLAKVRAEVTSVVALSNQPTSSHPSKTCSSFFLEPLEWMEPALLGTVEGKVRFLS